MELHAVTLATCSYLLLFPNHISMKKKSRLRCFTKWRPCRTNFSQYQVSSAMLWWLGDGDCYLMHKRAQSGDWLCLYRNVVSHSCHLFLCSCSLFQKLLCMHEQSTNHISHRTGLDVTHCTGSVSANTRPHQLCCGDHTVFRAYYESS